MVRVNPKLGSLFDGSGGFPLAGAMFGIEPMWASEVEPYPIAVTRERFPNMKHWGDISKINGAEIEPVDIVCFGSPCQDLSVAGKRAGLKHESNGDEETTRSGLLMEAVRIIKEMRDATNGVLPRFALWENVPGAFSSNKGEDFRIVLEELIKIAEPDAVMPPVPEKGWAYADYYIGDGWSIAYRVFDAQYWGKAIRNGDSGDLLYMGTPQRRRRIHLVLDLGGRCAGEVLFKREGLRGNPSESGTPWEGIGCNVEACTGLYDFERNGRVSTGISNDYKRPVTFEPGIAAREGGHIYEGVAGTLRANAGDNQLSVAYSIENHPADSRVSIDESGKVQCLTSRMGTGGGNVPMVMEAIPIHDMDTRYSGKRGDKADGKGNGLGVGCVGDPMNTITAGDRHGVVYALDRASFNQGQNAKYDFEISDSGINSTLVAKGSSAVAYVDTYQQVTGPLMANSHPGSYTGQDAFSDMLVAGVLASSAVNAEVTDGTISPCLMARAGTGGNQLPLVAIKEPQYIVRRLTPTECARLQGFPDWWGHLTEKVDMTDEEYRFWCKVRLEYAEIQGTARPNENGDYEIWREVKPDKKKGEDFEPYWENTGKPYKDKTKKQMLTWYNKLHTDGAEYKMWGNGIALPPALYVMRGIVDVLTRGDQR